MKLIINADDYGMRPSIDAAVESLYRLGVLKSASLLVYGTSAEDAGAFLAQHPDCGAGLHIDLDEIFVDSGFGKDDLGRFLVPDIFFEQDEIKEEILKMVQDQFARFVELTGRTPDHVDGHHHVHLFLPVLELIIPVLKQYQLRAVRFYSEFYPTSWQAGAAREVIAAAGLATTRLFIKGVNLPAPQDACSAEIMVHPALPVAAEEKWRTREYAVLADDEFKSKVLDSGYELCSYSDLVGLSCLPG